MELLLTKIQAYFFVSLWSCHKLVDLEQYQSIVDVEWNIIHEKLNKCGNIGAKIVLQRLDKWRSWHPIFCKSRCILCRPCDGGRFATGC
jgi:hypothetical protein